MKKIIIMAVASMAAVVVNAASITWGARNIFVPVAADASVSQDGIVMSSGTKFAAGALTVSLYWVDSHGQNQFIGDVATTGDGVIKASENVIATGTESALYTAMLADRGSTWKPEYFFTATYNTADGVYVYEGTANASVALGNLANSAISTTANFATAGSWSYAASVPEPTSGLLLLIGMAGLALRRRRA